MVTPHSALDVVEFSGKSFADSSGATHPATPDMLTNLLHDLTFVIGHEVQHGFNAQAAARRDATFLQGVRAMAVATTGALKGFASAGQNGPLASTSQDRRLMSRWIVGTAFFLMAFTVAHGQDASVADTPLRPSYYTCVKAARGVTLALNDCIGDEHGYQDKRLNSAYQRLRKSLGPDQRIVLRDEERAWIAQRDKTCAPDEGGGTASLLDTNQCQLDQTAARAAVLEGRIK